MLSYWWQKLLRPLCWINTQVFQSCLDLPFAFCFFTSFFLVEGQEVLVVSFSWWGLYPSLMHGSTWYIPMGYHSTCSFSTCICSFCFLKLVVYVHLVVMPWASILATHRRWWLKTRDQCHLLLQTNYVNPSWLILWSRGWHCGFSFNAHWQ